MRTIIERNLTVTKVQKLVINSATGKPFSKPSQSWSIPVYYAWRIIRFDMGLDTSVPVKTEASIYGHPQQGDTQSIVVLIENKIHKGRIRS